MWQNPDVHARTAEIRQQMHDEFPHLPGLSRTAAHYFDRYRPIIEEKIPSAAPVLEKIKRRFGTLDSDLDDVDPAGLLVILWDGFYSPESHRHFVDMLSDVGQHCIQGDTHRMFSSYVAFMRDESS